MGVSNLMYRPSSPIACNEIVPSGVNSYFSDPSESYYFNDRANQYEWCYVLNPSPAVLAGNYSSLTSWNAFSSSTLTPAMFTYSFPVDYKTSASNNDQLYFFVRPKGSTCSDAVKYQKQNLETYIYDPIFNVTTIANTDCSTVSAQLTVGAAIGLCYPVTISMENVSGSPLTGIATGPGTWISTSPSAPIQSPTGYTVGQTYTITLTDFSGRVFTIYWKPAPSGQYFYSAVNSTDCDGKENHRIYASPSINPGTIIKYLSGPLSTLPCGLVKGSTFTIPNDGNTYNNFYPQRLHPLSSSYPDVSIPTGRYVYEITNTCGVVSTVTITVNSGYYYDEPLQFTWESKCDASQLQLFPLTHLVRDGVNYSTGGVTYHQDQTTYYKVINCTNSSVNISTIPTTTWYPGNPGLSVSLALPNPYMAPVPGPGIYTIAMHYNTSSPASNCDYMATFEWEYTTNMSAPNPDVIVAYICQGGTTGHIKMSVLGGTPPYNYVIKSEYGAILAQVLDVNHHNLVEFELKNAKLNNPGLIYNIEITDACGTFFAVPPLQMIELSTAAATYVTPSTKVPPYTYCPGEIVELNVIALGNADYHWTGPNGFEISGQHPRFSAPYGGSGDYTVTVTPEFCPENPVTESINIVVLAAPLAPTVSQTYIFSCAPNNVNLTAETGAQTTSGCNLNWYNSSGTLLPSATVSAPATGTSETYYVSQSGCVGSCESERVMIVLTGNCNTCTNPPLQPSDYPWITTYTCAESMVWKDVLVGGDYSFLTISTSTNATGLATISGNTVIYIPSIEDEGKLITIYITAVGIIPCSPLNLSWNISVGQKLARTLQINDETICGSGTAMLKPSGAISGDTYKWYASPLDITPLYTSTFSFPNITTVPISAGTSITYYVAIASGACETSRVPVKATAYRMPNPLSAFPDRIVCDGDPVKLEYSYGSGGGDGGVDPSKCTWTNTNPLIGLPEIGTGPINFISENPTGAPITATITITPVTANGCADPSFNQSFTITVNKCSPYEIWNWADLAYLNVLLENYQQNQYANDWGCLYGKKARLMQDLGTPSDVNSYGKGSGAPLSYDANRKLGCYGYENLLTLTPSVSYDILGNQLLVGDGLGKLNRVAWYDTEGWLPIGYNQSSPPYGCNFLGEFDGQKNEINGLWIKDTIYYSPLPTTLHTSAVSATAL
jgi:hypothetical protein